jgi:biopolymer transport protein ExbD
VSFTQREARRIIRKAVSRVPEGEEIRHLNIMPMMDMMTILLVAFIFQASVSASALTASSVTLPRPTTSSPRARRP